MAFIPSNKSDLQTAINAWIADETSTTATYGDINTWNTSLITDMSDLFRNKTSFNEILLTGMYRMLPICIACFREHIHLTKPLIIGILQR